MAINCLAPAYLRLFYNANGHDHVMTLPVINDSEASDFLLDKYGGGTISQLDAITALLAVLEPFYAAADTFTGWEAFTQADCASAPVFRNVGTLSGEIGTGGGTDKPWVQAVMTFKTAVGGRGKFQFMESSASQDQKIALSGSSGAVAALKDYLLSDDNWIYARDNARLTVPLNLVTKINDKLRKKFLNP